MMSFHDKMISAFLCGVVIGKKVSYCRSEKKSKALSLALGNTKNIHCTLKHQFIQRKYQKYTLLFENQFTARFNKV